MLEHDEINIIKDFWPLIVKTIANSIDFGGFSQIILYFGLSTWTHIEYRIKRSTIYLFLLSIKQLFFQICNINIFGSKSQTLTQQNSRLLFSSTSFAHFVYSCCAMTSYSCTQLDLAFVVFCFSLKGQQDYISLYVWF